MYFSCTALLEVQTGCCTTLVQTGYWDPVSVKLLLRLLQQWLKLVWQILPANPVV